MTKNSIYKNAERIKCNSQYRVCFCENKVEVFDKYKNLVKEFNSREFDDGFFSSDGQKIVLLSPFDYLKIYDIVNDSLSQKIYLKTNIKDEFVAADNKGAWDMEGNYIFMPVMNKINNLLVSHINIIDSSTHEIVKIDELNNEVYVSYVFCCPQNDEIYVVGINRLNKCWVLFSLSAPEDVITLSDKNSHLDFSYYNEEMNALVVLYKEGIFVIDVTTGTLFNPLKDLKEKNKKTYKEMKKFKLLSKVSFDGRFLILGAHSFFKGSRTICFDVRKNEIKLAAYHTFPPYSITKIEENLWLVIQSDGNYCLHYDETSNEFTRELL